MTADRNTNLNAHPAFRGARLSGGLGFTGGDGIPLFPVPFTTIDYDDGDYVQTLSRLRIPRGLAGLYRIRADLGIQAINNVSRWHAELEVPAGLVSLFGELHSAAGLALDASALQTIVAEGTLELGELDDVQAVLTGTYFPPVVADFAYTAYALELHYLGRP